MVLRRRSRRILGAVCLINRVTSPVFPGQDCLEEYLLESGKGGSIAGMAYNPCGTDGGALVLNDELLKNIFVRGERILGKAVFAAKCSVIARFPTQDTMYGPAVLYTLFGDPALRLKVPQLTGITTRGTGVPPVMHDAAYEVFPNPVNGSTTIRYSSPVSGHVDLRLFDSAGKLVAVLVSRAQPAGTASCVLRPASHGLGRGVYVLELAARGLRLTRKLIVEK